MIKRQGSKVKNQTKGLHRRESNDVIAREISKISHALEARGSSQLPVEVSIAPNDGRDDLPSLQNIDAGGQVGEWSNESMVSILPCEAIFYKKDYDRNTLQ